MPADYVNKLARMFQDIKVSDDLNQEFKDAHRNNNEGIAGTDPMTAMKLIVHHTEIAVIWHNQGFIFKSYVKSQTETEDLVGLDKVSV